MKQTFFLLMLCLLFVSCTHKKIPGNSDPLKNTDKIYQYSVFTALANKVYDGYLLVANVKKMGDMGLGTFNGLDGEMIILDGMIYQFLANGKVKEADDSEKVPFVVTTFFECDQSFQVNKKLNYEDLKIKIEHIFESINYGYALKVQGNFSFIKCGGAPKQEKPYKNTLSEALINRPTFESKNINGTMVGFWFPDYVGGVNVPRFHLHFISEDKKVAGHVLDFKSSDLKVEIDRCNGFYIDLPQINDFKNGDFDLNQGYNKK